MSFENKDNKIISASDFANGNKNETNLSGKGSMYEAPTTVTNRFNWGAFFFTWIWGIFNKTWITLLLIPVWLFFYIAGIVFAVLSINTVTILFFNLFSNVVSLALQIWFGVKGNLWAWQNKKWNSIEHFHKVQRTWALFGVLIIIGFGLLGFIAAIILPSVLKANHSSMINAATKKQNYVIKQITDINGATGDKCKTTSNGLTDCFAKRLNYTLRNNNILELADGAVYEFYGDGLCKDKDSCYIVVYPIGKSKSQEDGKYTVSLFVNSNGFVKIKE